MHLAKRSLLLIRHGQSEWNAVKRWQGIADSPLTDLGRRQAELIGRTLASDPEVQISRVAASDLSRAADTAAIIARVLGLPEVIEDSRLREADAGPWQGMTPGEIAEAWPGFLEEHRRPVGFETAESVIVRATQACTDILRGATEDGLGSALAVTHSGLIRVLRRHLGAVDEAVPNLSGVWVHLGDGDELNLGRSFALEWLAAGAPDGPGEDPGEAAVARGTRASPATPRGPVG